MAPALVATASGGLAVAAVRGDETDGANPVGSSDRLEVSADTCFSIVEPNCFLLTCITFRHAALVTFFVGTWHVGG